jgi:hypothetical protein
MLSKSKASPYIVTLILSFVLSCYSNNLLRIKLKTCIINGWFSPTYENPRGFSIRFVFAKLVA